MAAGKEDYIEDIDEIRKKDYPQLNGTNSANNRSDLN